MRTKQLTAEKRIFIILFLLMLVLPTVLWHAGAGRGEAQLEEKRQLAGFPSEFSDTFSQEVGSWYADNAPFRETVIARDNSISQAFCKPYYTALGGIIRTVATPSWYTDKEQPYMPLFIKNSAIYGRGDWLFFNGEDSTKYYTGENKLSDEKMEKWRSVFVKLNKACKKKGIQLVVMVAPNKEHVYSEYMPSVRIRSEEKREAAFAEYMKDSGVIYLYPLDELKAAKSIYDTYYMQDTHWSGFGGYVGVKAIYDALGMKMTPPEDAVLVKEDWLGGDLAAQSGYTSPYEIAHVDYKSDVTFERVDYEDGYIEVYDSTADTGHNLVMITDSYRYASEGYLVRDFDHSVIAHRELLDDEIIENAVRELKEGDLLLLLAVERYDTLNEKAAKKVTKLLNMN